MAAAELTARRLRPADGVRREWLGVYGAIWAATLCCALLVVLARLGPPARHLLGLHLRADRAPAPSLGRVAALAAHNFPVAAWPVLLGVVGAHRHELARRAADVLLTGSVAVNVLPVGAALGAYGIALLPYIPQLPLEWAALALGASAWLHQRHRRLNVTQGLTLLGLIAGVLLCAASVETLAVPHRRAVHSTRSSWGGHAPRSIDIQGETHGQGDRT